MINQMKLFIENKEYDKAIKLFYNNKNCLFHNEEALYLMGYSIELKHDHYIELNGALEYYERSASLEYDPAKYRLAEYYFDQYNEYKEYDDLEMFRKYIIECAENEYAPAMLVLSAMYDDDRYLNEDPSMVKKYIQLAASKGYAPALYQLAYCYENGDYFKADLGYAFEFYEAAAKKNNELALLKLAQEHLYGRLTSLNFKKIFEYLNSYYNIISDENYKRNLYNRVSEDLGRSYFESSQEAIYYLAFLYEKGLGVEEDINKAKELYEEISFVINEAKYRLLLIETSSNNYNEDNAFKNLIRLVETENFMRQIDIRSDRLYPFYIDDKRLPDRLLDRLYYDYETDNNYAKYNIYRLLYISNKWLTSCYDLGKLYYSGYPYKDKEKAIEYFTEGASAGCRDCAYWLGKYYMKSDVDLAFLYINDAAKSSDSKAKYDYGYMLYYGIGCDKNEKKGIEELKIAASFGCRRSRKLLKELKVFK